MSNKLRRKSKSFSNSNKKTDSLKQQSEILQMIRSAAIKDATSYSTKVFLTAFAIVLREQWGYGTKRVSTALSEVNKLISQIAEGEIPIEDLIERIDKELGIKIITNSEE